MPTNTLERGAKVNKLLHDKIVGCLPSNGLILIIGRRGSGKSTLAYCIAEYFKGKRECYSFNFPKPDLLPDFIKPISDLDFPEGSVVIVDEGYMNFSSRQSLSERNKFISNLNGLARQKDLLVIYISQESTSIDINIIRGIEVMFIKALSINQVRFERKELRNMLQRIKNEIDSIKDPKMIRKSTYIICDLIDKKFEGLIVNSNDKPSFWSEELSKVWKEVKLSENDSKSAIATNEITLQHIDKIINSLQPSLQSVYFQILDNIYKPNESFNREEYDKASIKAMEIFLQKFPSALR